MLQTKQLIAQQKVTLQSAFQQLRSFYCAETLLCKKGSEQDALRYYKLYIVQQCN